ncbi:uncharacterized protein LOC131231626 [Magnolia sinica]|uniref:uncharacterized protein LOC131231626 n=1 Tax=Magnolia sinica TaxID=86752 RepID=UPI00265A0D6F|nr:uncharacterized protein LOC131231626 [Magnolia sinica]
MAEREQEEEREETHEQEEQREETCEQEEHPLEERTLHLLHDSKIDQEFSEAKQRKKGGKKHKVRWMKRPMAIPEVILEFRNEDLRENALRCLSNFLLERREEDPDNYCRAGFLLFNSCVTMTILMQEVVEFYRKMVDGTLNIRASKRVANVLTLFQSIAANGETRQKFVNSCVPNFLIPLILFQSPEEIYEDVRAISLSVIGILCQAREPEVIQWAIESDMVEVCRTSIEIGNELSKVIAMHILESMLQDRSGMSYICNPLCSHLLKGLMETWKHLVSLLAVYQDFSPRLLFHIIRCYVLLCNHSTGLNTVMESLPDPIENDTFQDITEEFPIIGNLRRQLLLNIGVEMEFPIPSETVIIHPIKEKTSTNHNHWFFDSFTMDKMPLMVIDLDQDFNSPTSLDHFAPLFSTGKGTTGLHLVSSSEWEAESCTFKRN